MMQRTTLAVFVVAVVALVAAGGLATADAGAAQDEMVTVELSVTTPDDEPIGGADVVIEWDDGSVETTTRSNGRVLEDVPTGADLDVTLEHDEYVQNVPYQVSDVEANQLIETTMYPPATIDVEVLTEDAAVDGAAVRLRKHGQSRAADEGETGEDGIYSSAAIEEGTYDVRVSKAGYYDERDSVDVEDATEHTIQIERGRLSIDLVTQDPTPEGPGQVSASVAFERDGSHVKTVTTSDADTTSVGLDVNTRYELSAERDDYRTSSSVLRTGEEDDEYVLNMTRTRGISMQLDSQAIVVGENLRVEVVDEYERPVEDATVFVDDEERATTDQRGVARVPIERGGDATVHAEYDGLETERQDIRGIAEGEDASDLDDDGMPGFGVLPALLAGLLATALLLKERRA